LCFVLQECQNAVAMGRRFGFQISVFSFHAVVLSVLTAMTLMMVLACTLAGWTVDCFVKSERTGIESNLWTESREINCAGMPHVRAEAIQ
jgi:hypothetical protein